MKTDELIKKLKQLNKSYYAMADFQLLLGQSRPSIRVVLNRLVKSGKLLRLRKNVYVLNEERINYQLIAQQLDRTSYLSFESILSEAGILSQIPQIITLASFKRSKKITLGERAVEYRKLKKEFDFGYYLREGIKSAYPEKALIDLLYLKARGKSYLNLSELDLNDLNKEKVKKYLINYPVKVKKMYRKLIGGSLS